MFQINLLVQVEDWNKYVYKCKADHPASKHMAKYLLKLVLDLSFLKVFLLSDWYIQLR